MIPFFCKKGRIVKIKIGKYIFTGRVNKLMFPGYEFRDTDSRVLRYSVEDLNESGHYWVIREQSIIDPPIVDIKCGKVKKDLYL